jgi:hypothetical protein
LPETVGTLDILQQGRQSTVDGRPGTGVQIAAHNDRLVRRHRPQPSLTGQGRSLNTPFRCKKAQVGIEQTEPARGRSHSDMERTPSFKSERSQHRQKLAADGFEGKPAQNSDSVTPLPVRDRGAKNKLHAQIFGQVPDLIDSSGTRYADVDFLESRHIRIQPAHGLKGFIMADVSSAIHATVKVVCHDSQALIDDGFLLHGSVRIGLDGPNRVFEILTDDGSNL